MNKKLLLIIFVLVVFLSMFFLVDKFNKSDDKSEKSGEISFIEVKTNKESNSKLIDKGNVIIFTTAEFHKFGDMSTLKFKVKNNSKEDIKINGVLCNVKGVYKNPDSPTKDEEKNAQKNGIELSNYVTAGLSNIISGKILKSGKTSEIETFSVSVVRDLKEMKGKKLTYECILDISKINENG